MLAFVEGLGLVGPGLRGWQASRAMLAGKQAYCSAPTAVAASDLLPAAERRRTGLPVKLALAAGQEAFASAGRDAAATATVFTSSSGDGDNVHQLCEALATPERQISPTRFHNSVHNAPAGYWSIAAQAMPPSTSLAAYDASFAAGLLEAVVQLQASGQPRLLVAYDAGYPAPLHEKRPIPDAFGLALVLAPVRTEHAIARIGVALGGDAAHRGDPAILDPVHRDPLVARAVLARQPRHQRALAGARRPGDAKRPRASGLRVQGRQQRRRAGAFVLDDRQRAREGARVGGSDAVGQRSRLSQKTQASSWRAITSRWISLVPSPMVVSFTSRKNFSAG